MFRHMSEKNTSAVKTAIPASRTKKNQKFYYKKKKTQKKKTETAKPIKRGRQKYDRF